MMYQLNTVCPDLEEMRNNAFKADQSAAQGRESCECQRLQRLKIILLELMQEVMSSCVMTLSSQLPEAFH